MNPYKVLGVSENATPEEIRAAYLTLVKKYHPDKYTDSPLKEQAGEKLKDINLAYEMLTKKPSSGQAYNSSAHRTGGYGGRTHGTPYSGPYADEFDRAHSYINQNNLNAARMILDRVDVHNAEWYYLYGIIYLRQGWYEKARACIQKAYELDPDNTEYRNAYASLNNSGRAYTSDGYGGVGTGNSVCCTICPLLMCLELCGGGCCC